MGYNFRPVERDQQYLMPVSLRDWLPADDLAWFVLDAVGELDLAISKGWKLRREARDHPPRGRIPAALSLTERMERRLLTRRGKARYRLRAQIVEPVFGQTKEARGFRRFARRGRAACAAEWQLVCATHNLLKLWRSGRQYGPAPPSPPPRRSRARSTTRAMAS